MAALVKVKGGSRRADQLRAEGNGYGGLEDDMVAEGESNKEGVGDGGGSHWLRQVNGDRGVSKKIESCCFDLA